MRLVVLRVVRSRGVEMRRYQYDFRGGAWQLCLHIVERQPAMAEFAHSHPKPTLPKHLQIAGQSSYRSAVAAAAISDVSAANRLCGFGPERPPPPLSFPKSPTSVAPPT